MLDNNDKTKRQMKTQSKYKNFTFSEVTVDDHAEDNLRNRFGMTFSQVMAVSQYFKSGSKECRHKVVRNKIASYPNQKPFYNEKLNMLLMVDVNTKVVKGTLYLDGRDGYAYLNK